MRLTYIISQFLFILLLVFGVINNWYVAISPTFVLVVLFIFMYVYGLIIERNEH